MYGLIGIYKDNPTKGATDGTEVSTAGTFTSPITFRLNAEQNEIQTVKLAVRTAEGYKTSGTVTIADRDDVDDHLQLCWTQNGTFTDSISTNDVITAVNKIFYARGISRSSEYPIVDRAACFAIQAGLTRV